jgi:starch phosphorylase
MNAPQLKISATNLRQRLEQISRNLWWTWQPEVSALFHGLDPELWRRVNHNPVAFLKAVDDETLERTARTRALETRIQATVRRLDEYVNSLDTWGYRHAALLKAHPVAYFSAEFGLHESLPLYSGGLGVLAGDHLKSASDLGIPLVGVGLFYLQGYFRQYLDENYRQREAFGPVDPDDMAFEVVRKDDGQPLTISVPSGHEQVQVVIWRAQVGRVKLFMLDTDVEGNSPEFREVTHRLYWGDNRSRIRQELILGVGGVRALRALGYRPGVYHLNEGHSAFALLEAVREEMHNNGVDFDHAWRRISRHSLFTTHTPVPAGHDRFHPDLMEEHLGWLREQLGLSQQDFLALGREGQDHGDFCMTVLALKLTDTANAVSALHGHVSRRMWQHLWPEKDLREIPIGHITNGVHTRSWMAPQMQQLVERHLGSNWAERLESGLRWERVRDLDPNEVWETHEVLRFRLIDFVRQRYMEQEVRRGRDPEKVVMRASELLDPDALTLGFARRFATYKRADLLFSDRERFEKLFTDSSRPIQFVFAGKAHPRDEAGKDIIQRIAKMQDEEPFRNRLVFIEDYDINVARHMVQGVDVWVNNPLKPEEACGTSGMKVILNGGLNCSILDGWWAEAYDGMNGFAIDSEGPHIDREIQRERDAEALYKVLEQELVPTFYDRDESDARAGGST